MFTFSPNLFLNLSDSFGVLLVFFSVLSIKTSDNSIADQSDSMETRSTDDVQMSSNLPVEQSEPKTASLSDAALQDGERKAQPVTPDQSPFRNS